MRVAIAKFPGSNCDQDVAYAISRVPDAWLEVVWHTELSPERYELVVLPGGFSYADRLRAGAIAAHTPLIEKLIDYVKDGGLVLGICNGFQILVEAGLLPGSLLPNKGLRFICKWVSLKVMNSDTPFTNAFNEGEVVKMPIAHYEGRYYTGGQAPRLFEERRIAFVYADERGCVSEECNPNGSENSIAGVFNDAFNVLGMMPHPERASDPLLSPYGTEDGLRVFLSVANYVKGGA